MDIRVHSSATRGELPRRGVERIEFDASIVDSLLLLIFEKAAVALEISGVVHAPAVAAASKLRASVWGIGSAGKLRKPLTQTP